MQHRPRIRLAAASLLLALTGLCSTAARADITVGAPFALSGALAEQTKWMRQGAELAARQVNAQGGVLGQTYRLAFADTACTPDEGVRAVRQLIDAGAVALVGPICSGVTLRQAQSVSIPAGVVTVSVASASSLITQLQDRDLVFRTAPSEAVKAQALARQALAMGIRVIAVSHASDAYNTGVAQVFAETYQQLGGRVVVNQVHQPDKPDLQREAAALLSGAGDVALFAYSGASGLRFLKTLFADARTERVLGTDGLMSNTLATALTADQLARMTFVLAATDTERDGYQRWKSMAASAGIDPDAAYAAHAYDAAFLVALAIEAAGTPDKARLQAALRAVSGPAGTAILPGEWAKARALLQKGIRINYDGASGPVDFDVAGDVAGQVRVERFVNGAWRPQQQQQRPN